LEDLFKSPYNLEAGDSIQVSVAAKNSHGLSKFSELNKAGMKLFELKPSIGMPRFNKDSNE
jgi:hypothetical protein